MFWSHVQPGIMASKLLSTTLEAASVPTLGQLSKVAFWNQVVLTEEMLGWVGDCGGRQLVSTKQEQVEHPDQITSSSWWTSMKVNVKVDVFCEGPKPSPARSSACVTNAEASVLTDG